MLLVKTGESTRMKKQHKEMSDSIAPKLSRREDELIALKLMKLRQQKELADEFNQILTQKGGLIAHTRKTCKNLECAINVAARPGAIEYYQPPEDIMLIVKNNDLAALEAKIARLQRELDQVDQDISQGGAAASATLASSAATTLSSALASQSYASLKEWLGAHGEPTLPATSGWMTNFEDSSKMYGGTSHHRGFKSLSKAMRKGRITR